MSISTARTRFLGAGGAMLAATGLAAAMAVGPAAFADTATTTADAEVASTITLTGDTAFSIAGAPGDTATSTSGLTAESNNTAGYNVSVQADVAELTPSDTTANGDTIAVSSLEVEDSTATYAPLSDTETVTVHSQDSKSAEGGDSLTASYQLNMPFVNADTYSGGLTFTAAAN